MLNKTKVRLLG